MMKFNSKKSRVRMVNRKANRKVTHEMFDINALKAAKEEGVKEAIAMLNFSKLDDAIDILTPIQTVDYCIEKLGLLVDGK